MPIAEVWQVDHSGLLNGERVHNVYFYRQDTGSGNASDLAQAFQDVITPLLTAWQANNMVWDTIRVINLGSLTDFAIATTSNAGSASGNMLPPDDAVNFTLRVNTRAVRPGSKRYSAIAAEHQSDGTINNATVLTALGVLGEALADPIAATVDPAAQYQQIVVKRVPYVTAEGNDSYRLPETDLELVFGDVTAALVNVSISHQDTRSNGR